GKMHYNLLGHGDHWFPGKNLKGADYAVLEPAVRGSRFPPLIMERLKEADRMLQGEEKKRLSASD
ncbi:MAG: aldo/keto reductase, partial [Verrucomicrobiota bacterium]